MKAALLPRVEARVLPERGIGPLGLSPDPFLPRGGIDPFGFSLPLALDPIPLDGAWLGLVTLGEAGPCGLSLPGGGGLDCVVDTVKAVLVRASVTVVDKGPSLFTTVAPGNITDVREFPAAPSPPNASRVPLDLGLESDIIGAKSQTHKTI